MTRVLIVDDEPSARARLRTLIGRYDDLTIAGECGTTEEAQRQIARLAPDIVFLDIQMPGGSPSEMLRTAGQNTAKTAFVFVTAHSTFAVDAFDVDAADYLLKPLTASRFAKAVAKARKKLLTAGERLSLRQTDGRVVSLAPEEIVWFEASGNNLTLHLRSATLELRSTMGAFCQRVAPFGFTRIHRSFAVNDALVRQLEPWSHGEYVVIMDDGTRLNSSRTFRTGVASLLASE